MKINIIRAILFVLLIATFLSIFGFSNQNGKESGKLSQNVTKIVTKNMKNIQNLEKNKKQQIMKKIEMVIRKLAHFSIYTWLGILLMLFFNTYNLKLINKVRV